MAQDDPPRPKTPEVSQRVFGEFGAVSVLRSHRRSRFRTPKRSISLTRTALKILQMPSESQLGKVVVTGLDVVEGGLGLVIFDKVMLDSGFLGLGEDTLPVDVALADIGHVSRLAVWTSGALVVVSVGVLAGPVLHVDQGEAAWIHCEVLYRVLVADSH